MIMLSKFSSVPQKHGNMVLCIVLKCRFLQKTAEGQKTFYSIIVTMNCFSHTLDQFKFIYWIYVQDQFTYQFNLSAIEINLLFHRSVTIQTLNPNIERKGAAYAWVFMAFASLHFYFFGSVKVLNCWKGFLQEQDMVAITMKQLKSVP